MLARNGRGGFSPVQRAEGASESPRVVAGRRLVRQVPRSQSAERPSVLPLTGSVAMGSLSRRTPPTQDLGNVVRPRLWLLFRKDLGPLRDAIADGRDVDHPPARHIPRAEASPSSGSSRWYAAGLGASRPVSSGRMPLPLELTDAQPESPRDRSKPSDIFARTARVRGAHVSWSVGLLTTTERAPRRAAGSRPPSPGPCRKRWRRHAPPSRRTSA